MSKNVGPQGRGQGSPEAGGRWVVVGEGHVETLGAPAGVKYRLAGAPAPQTITSNHVWADLGHFKVFDFFRKMSVRRGHGSPEAGAGGRRERGEATWRP